MPLWKCSECHHEWEGTNTKCGWCGNKGYQLQEKTSLENMIEDFCDCLYVHVRPPYHIDDDGRSRCGLCLRLRRKL